VDLDNSSHPEEMEPHVDINDPDLDGYVFDDDALDDLPESESGWQEAGDWIARQQASSFI